MTATRTPTPDVLATLPSDLHVLSVAEFTSMHDAAHLAADVGITGARVVDMAEWLATPAERQGLVLVPGQPLAHLVFPEVDRG